MRKIVHFVHGNGFPSPCYQQLFMHLNQNVDCCYIDKVGHTEEFPVTDNWNELVDEVIYSIKTQSSRPVIGVGHSLGGVLSLIAAILEPDLFKQVILLDSPLIGRIKSNVIRFSKAVGMIDRLTPAFRTKNRAKHWSSREQVLSYLKSRDLFKTFTDLCLNDYIDYGMQYTKEGYSLRFDPSIEYQIYRTIPHIMAKYEGKLTVPTVLIYGDKSNIVDRLDLSYMKKKYHINCVEIKGTHMFPMEDPKTTAKLIMDVIVDF